MPADRYRDIVLTIIAAALIVIALPRLEMPEVQAAEEQPTEAAMIEQQPQVGPKFTPTHVGPLRWRIGYAAERNTDGNKEECHTVISLLNAASTASEVEVAFLDDDGTFVGVKTATVSPNETYVIITHTTGQYTSHDPFISNWWAETGYFSGGFALVWADDPRVLATGFFMCRDDYRASYQVNSGLTISNIPASPVAATAQYFQAGMPVTWTPPMVAPEVPE